MKFNNKVFMGLMALLLVIALSGCNFLKARDELNKGIQSFKTAKYETAIEHFKLSLQLDPNNDNAYLYLASAYAALYVPGVTTPENVEVAEAAIKAFQKVLEKDPANVNSARGVAGIYFQMKEFEKAKEYHKKVTELQPTNAEAFYAYGNVDWWILYIHKEYPPAQKNELAVEGLQYLEKATQLNPTYDDAFFYINLLYRQQAQVVLEDFLEKNPKLQDKAPIPLDASSKEAGDFAKKYLPADLLTQFTGYLAQADKNWEKARQLKKENEAKAETKGAIDPNK
jgi:tetratricopeptide (TPR) repeat protein